MIFDILTLLPEFFDSPLKPGILGRAINGGLFSVNCHNIRDFTTDRHRTVDDTPYGGGPGMVLKPEPVVSAIEALKGESPEPDSLVILLSPQGATLTQEKAATLTACKRLILVCGRYEGIDERIRTYVDHEISIGDYILSGGESAALVLIEAVGRLLPGVIEADSVETESFTDGLLEYPQYTRPRDFRGQKVPEVLLSGDHGKIDKWRETKRLERTSNRRPDLIK